MRLADLIGQLDTERAKIAASLVDGVATEPRIYWQMVGKAQGLKAALEIIDYLIEEDERDVE